MEKIIRQIVKVRKDKGYCQEYMANRLGISRSSYSRFESLKGAFKATTLFDACDVLGIDISLDNGNQNFNVLYKQRIDVSFDDGSELFCLIVKSRKD